MPYKVTFNESFYDDGMKCDRQDRDPPRRTQMPLMLSMILSKEKTEEKLYPKMTKEYIRRKEKTKANMNSLFSITFIHSVIRIRFSPLSQRLFLGFYKERSDNYSVIKVLRPRQHLKLTFIPRHIDGISRRPSRPSRDLLFS